MLMDILQLPVFTEVDMPWKEMVHRHFYAVVKERKSIMKY